MVLEGLHKLARGWLPSATEGPGALVCQEVWTSAVRRLADDLLGATGLPGPEGLTAPQAQTRALLADMSPDASPPRTWDRQLVCVVGCGRSGTTWLERLLMAAPETGGVDGTESSLFALAHPLWLMRGRLQPLADEEQVVAALRRFHGTVLTEALAQHSPSASVFVEKTPRHSLQLAHISACFPDVRVVHVVRDGRDVARSMSEIDFFGVPDPADAMRVWRRVLREVRRAAPGLRHFREVRYEALLADPVDQGSELLRWIGVRVDARVEEELTRRAARRVSTHAGTAHALGAESWRTLSRRTQARLYGEGGAALRREGYATRGDVYRAALRPSYWGRLLVRYRAAL